jgi:hypothetical protein
MELPLPSVVFSVSYNDDATGKHTFVERFMIPKRRAWVRMALREF